MTIGVATSPATAPVTVVAISVSPGVPETGMKPKISDPPTKPVPAIAPIVAPIATLVMAVGTTTFLIT